VGENVVAANGGHPGRRGHISGQNAHSGGFAGPIGTEKAEDFAFANVEAYIANGNPLTVIFSQILNLDHKKDLITLNRNSWQLADKCTESKFETIKL
jgi:hypothetical protein